MKWLVSLLVVAALIVGGFAAKAIAWMGKCCGQCPPNPTCPCDK